MSRRAPLVAARGPVRVGAWSTVRRGDASDERCPPPVECAPNGLRGHERVTKPPTRPPPTGRAPNPYERIGAAMTAWLSVLVPLLVMFFALGMERVESRMRESTVRQDELDEMLEQPRPDEVRALFRSGTGRALELFRLRNRRRRGARRSQVPSA
ncbi:hypothetical protein Ae406Ps2_4012 [Pseudonocardia sp. Ae406_Ps2]|nr:hypothetical protein Ae331Ps2_1944c [Pseudonocardia sp. Ae331_Ps2]OLM04012.1 hypothetical protein Ae406Ps2_4012 [Pseudonocardia sp. Ae406_Ps2]OLM11158.1 hypothetical protein Ae505Ps2_1281c [Pseudonocardia sp. Ae505_Ps2]OLM25560.1 hypothetical protein Ae706Ps2_3993 [Pseudonocardia sp. Ae706_Ps2]